MNEDFYSIPIKYNSDEESCFLISRKNLRYIGSRFSVFKVVLLEGMPPGEPETHPKTLPRSESPGDGRSGLHFTRSGQVTRSLGTAGNSEIRFIFGFRNKFLATEFLAPNILWALLVKIVLVCFCMY